MPKDKAAELTDLAQDFHARLINPGCINSVHSGINSAGLATDDTSSDSSRQQASTRTSEEHSETSATSQSSDSDDRDDQNYSFNDQRAPDDNTTIEINALGKIKGFVLLGVKGAKRLRGARTRLAQIDTETYKDDDSFFDEMAVQFKKLRGCMRYFFSIWAFGSCQLVVVSAL